MRTKHKICRKRQEGPPSDQGWHTRLSSDSHRYYISKQEMIDDRLNALDEMSPAFNGRGNHLSNLNSTSYCDNLFNQKSSTTATIDEPCRSSTHRRTNHARLVRLSSLLSFLIVCLISSVIQAQRSSDPQVVSQIARQLVKRATTISTSPPKATTNHGDLNHRSREVSPKSMHTPPALFSNYVKLTNNSTSQHRSVSSASNSRAKAINNQITRDINLPSTNTLPDKVCTGTSNRLSGQMNKDDHYKFLVDRYSNCTHIVGNLEITWLERGPDNKTIDLTFLEQIKEITGYLLIAYVQAEKIRLPNLLIIRGVELFRLNNGKKDEFSMFVIQNDLRYIEMPNLREIISGHVGFYFNKNLCSIDTIDWVEILNTGFMPQYAKDSSMLAPKCPECHSNCSSPACWGPDEGLCQQFSKTNCAPQCDKGRCYGLGSRDCCHMMCAGGCTGPKQTDCFACKNFNNSGECVPECPAITRYNPTLFLWENNPNGRHAYGSSCVEKCPEHLLRDNGACVRSCPPDKRSQSGECVSCVGPCPKNCLGVDVVNSHNIEQLVNCTEIEGTITILDTSFAGYKEVYNNTVGTAYEPMHPSRLNVLNNVRKITGYLNIQANHPEFKNLSFLSKLETIDGRQITDMFHALAIIKTSLTSLNLRSLKSIKHGNVLIEENKDLCYADESQFSRKNISKSGTITIRNNADDKHCRKVGLTCHAQCAPGSCWGPGQDDCLACNHYKLDDYCVRDCASTRLLGILSYDEGKDQKTCGRCHQECKTGCYGVEANQCVECKNFKDGWNCVKECPGHKYNDNGVCQECSSRCINGCTGPSDRLGPGGCNACDKFVLQTTNSSTLIASCLRSDEQCPTGYYQEYGAEVDKGHHRKAFESKPVCKRCHQKCKRCTGYGTHKDVCDCAGYIANDQCEDSCPRDFYPDEKMRRCLRCSRECNGCFGPTDADCSNCKVYRIYHGSSGAVASARVADKSSVLTKKQEGRFNCTSQCPAEKPYRISEGNMIDPYCSEDPGPDTDNPKIVWIGSTSFLLLLISFGSIMFCVSVYRCQIEKDKIAKLAMALSGINDDEPTKQSNIEPNRGNFNPITTSELRQGKMLGHGVGGTVYKAYWCPKDEPKKKIPVAMKILRDNGQQNMHKEFLDEAYIMASVNHENLVNLLGVCATPKELIIVTPLMPLGCLRDYVERNKNKIGPKHLLEWSKQIANGMAYLEEHRMVHRDLALRNVLLQNSNRALISDFGLAKFLELDQSEYHSGGGRLPIKWLAPECIRERKFTHKSDVWAFGVTIWELLTFGEKPFEEFEPKDVPMEIERGGRPAQPNYVTAEVYKVMYACWFYNPDDRPNFEMLKQDFVSFARDPERYLDWRPNDLLQNSGRGSNDDDGSNDYDFDEETSLDRPNNSPLPNCIDATMKMNEMVGLEMRQHGSESDAHKSSPAANKMGMFSNVSNQPLIAEDVFSRSSQQTSAKSSNTTIPDPNNNFFMTTNSNNFDSHSTRQVADSWWSVAGPAMSNNSLAHRSEQPTDSDDYLMPSPCSKEEKFTRFYEQQCDHRLLSRPRPTSSRDPPHSAGLIGVSNDAYFMTRSMNYANTIGTTKASSGHIPSSLV